MEFTMHGICINNGSFKYEETEWKLVWEKSSNSSVPRQGSPVTDPCIHNKACMLERHIHPRTPVWWLSLIITAIVIHKIMHDENILKKEAYTNIKLKQLSYSTIKIWPFLPSGSFKNDKHSFPSLHTHDWLTDWLYVRSHNHWSMIHRFLSPFSADTDVLYSLIIIQASRLTAEDEPMLTRSD